MYNIVLAEVEKNSKNCTFIQPLQLSNKILQDLTRRSLVSWVNNKCLQSFFLLLSLRLKDTDTREEAVIVGVQGRWERGAAPWPPPPSSSSSLLHSLVSSSLTSRGGPRVCPRSWLTSKAFCWAFSTADTHARRLQHRQTHTSYNCCISVCPGMNSAVEKCVSLYLIWLRQSALW